MMTRSTLLVLASVALAAGACDPTDPCDPGQAFSNGVCVSLIDAAPPAPDAAPASDDASPAADACTDDLGSTCTSDDDCGCVSRYCAIQPGDPDGYCTRTGCLDDPSVCPEGWGCLDLSMFFPGLPSICTMP
jgi:hypothetical protein